MPLSSQLSSRLLVRQLSLSLTLLTTYGDSQLFRLLERPQTTRKIRYLVVSVSARRLTFPTERQRLNAESHDTCRLETCKAASNPWPQSHTIPLAAHKTPAGRPFTRFAARNSLAAGRCGAAAGETWRWTDSYCGCLVSVATWPFSGAWPGLASDAPAGQYSLFTGVFRCFRVSQCLGCRAEKASSAKVNTPTPPIVAVSVVTYRGQIRQNLFLVPRFWILFVFESLTTTTTTDHAPVSSSAAGTCAARCYSTLCVRLSSDVQEALLFRI